MRTTTNPLGADEVPAEPAEPDPPAWTDVLAGDFASLGGLADGSPVAARARLNNQREVRYRKELTAFRATQTGPYDVAIADAAEQFGLDPFLLKGLLWNESRLDEDLVGKRIYRKVGGKRRAVAGGARGIAQFTAEGISAVNEHRRRRHLRGERVVAFTRVQVMRPEVAIPAAAELLASYIERFGRDGGITAYNSGPYGGRLVARYGFHAARRAGKLNKVGNVPIQGHRFLLNVLRKTNELRRGAGLRPLPPPSEKGPPPRRKRPNT